MDSGLAVIFIAEGDFSAAEVQEAMVGDGGLVGVAAEVFNDRFGTAEGCFCVNDPGLAVASVEPASDLHFFGRR